MNPVVTCPLSRHHHSCVGFHDIHILGKQTTLAIVNVELIVPGGLDRIIRISTTCNQHISALSMSLGTLPSELYAAIFSHLPDDFVSGTILSLTRAIPNCPIPVDRLFETIRLSSAERFPQLHRRLRGTPASFEEGAKVHPDARFIKELRLESWNVDPQVVINLLVLLSEPHVNIKRMTIWVGPNFGPENMEEILQRPRTRLEALEIRFRPYLQRANYYTFLAGAYFDSSLLALARWPNSSLSSLSVVQDPFDHVSQFPNTFKKDFAQPIVFFKLTPLSALSTAQALVDVRSLKLRIPSREVSSFVAASPSAFPSLETLDLSTCNVKDVDLERLLMRFSRLKHIILDNCALMRSLHIAGGEAEGHGEWAALGRLCVLAGSKLAKQREKELKDWIEMHSAMHRRETQGNDDAVGQAVGVQVRRARAGRKGLATATISLRAEDSISSSSASNQALGASPSPLLAILLKQKIRILPSPPSLAGLCTSSSSPSSTTLHVDDVEHSRIQAEFASGWAEGISQLQVKWKRLRTTQSISGKFRVMCISTDKLHMGPDGANLTDDNPIRDLVDIGQESTLSWEQLEEGQWPPPTLCLAGKAWGEGNAAQHIRGCGHFISINTVRN